MAKTARRTGKDAAPVSPAEEDKRSRLSEAFVEAVLADFRKHGAAAIETMRTDKPDLYFKLVAAILPKEVGGEDTRQNEPRRLVITRRIVHVKN